MTGLLEVTEKLGNMACVIVLTLVFDMYVGRGIAHVGDKRTRFLYVRL